MLPIIKRQNPNWLPTVFNDFFNDEWFPMRPMLANPAINVKESEKSFDIEMAVPGMSKEDVKVHINDKDQLIVSVEKKKETKEEDKSSRFIRREFHITHFEQALLLPENIDRSAITAKVCSGILHINLPKLQVVPPKEPTRVIEIQ